MNERSIIATIKDHLRTPFPIPFLLSYSMCRSSLIVQASEAVPSLSLPLKIDISPVREILKRALSIIKLIIQSSRNRSTEKTADLLKPTSTSGQCSIFQRGRGRTLDGKRYNMAQPYIVGTNTRSHAGKSEVRLDPKVKSDQKSANLQVVSRDHPAV
jgi:hypothetical protein